MLSYLEWSKDQICWNEVKMKKTVGQYLFFLSVSNLFVSIFFQQIAFKVIKEFITYKIQQI